MKERKIQLGPVTVSDNTDPFVIAEIGHNHQGSLQMAKELFRTAKECGASAVKLQKRDNKNLYTKELYNKPYDHENSFGATYGQHRDFLEFGRKEYLELKKYAEQIGILFFATPFDFFSVDFLEELEMPFFKVASADLKNTPLLKYIARLGKSMIVSTGGAAMEDVERAYHTLMPINPNVCFMQCTASYPTNPEDMNLRVIQTYRERFPDAVVGLSDHQNGIAMSVLAYGLGARVFEKHFTLNRALKGTDHAFSLEPVGMKKMVRDLQRARQAIGDGIKRQLPGEIMPITKMAKKLVTARSLPAGHVITKDDIAIKSPGDGLPPYELKRLLGRVVLKSMEEESAFHLEDLGEAEKKLKSVEDLGLERASR